jgi:hypothetical protein
MKIRDNRVIQRLFDSNDFVHVKLSGGATAQCLGLMNALYASNKLQKKFKVSYYPYSTGTYWPFAIRFLLSDDEVLNTNVNTRGINSSDEIQVGQMVESHPLLMSGLSYEKILSLIRRMKIEPGLQMLRRELSVRSNPANLYKINRYYKVITGGFAQIIDSKVFDEMNRRFLEANYVSPFDSRSYTKGLTVIHYRLGDKRATPFALKFTPDFNSDLIIAPETYRNLIDEVQEVDKNNVYVVSDEPVVARDLLRSVGVEAKVYSFKGDIWEDLGFMSRANVFIGSRSQVSQLANMCVEHRGGISIMLNLKVRDDAFKFQNTRYISAETLPEEHVIYTKEPKLDSKAHSAYFMKQNNGTEQGFSR